MAYSQTEIDLWRDELDAARTTPTPSIEAPTRDIILTQHMAVSYTRSNSCGISLVRTAICSTSGTSIDALPVVTRSTAYNKAYLEKNSIHEDEAHLLGMLFALSDATDLLTSSTQAARVGKLIIACCTVSKYGCEALVPMMNEFIERVTSDVDFEVMNYGNNTFGGLATKIRILIGMDVHVEVTSSFRGDGGQHIRWAMAKASRREKKIRKKQRLAWEKKRASIIKSSEDGAKSLESVGKRRRRRKGPGIMKAMATLHF